jgi:DNA gyrase subunit A
MTEVQAEAVVRLQLGQLAKLPKDEILKEYGELYSKIQSYETLLSSDKNILDVIKQDLIELRNKYSEERQTEITGEAAHINREDLIAEEEQAVTLSHGGYIKRLPLSTYRSQHRGGRGVSGGATKEDDFIEHFFVASTHAYLLCFTNQGQLYWLRVFDLPEGSRISAGRAIANVLELKAEERITSVVPVRHLDAEHSDAEGLHLLMATKRGLVKKTALRHYCRPKKGGIIGIGLEEGDTLIGVAMVRDGDEVLLCTREGMAIRFDQSDARPMGRGTYGVKGINLGREDEVVGMVVADPVGFLLTVCANGYGKRTPFGANTSAESAEEETSEEPVSEEGGEAEQQRSSSASYRKQRRGGKGIISIKTTERNGPVVGVAAVSETDDVMLITTNGMVNRTHVREISVVGRNTQGVRVMNLHEGDRIASIARVAVEGEDEVDVEVTEVGVDAPPV